MIKTEKVTIRTASLDDLGEVAFLWAHFVKELAPAYTPNAEWWEQIAANLFRSGIYHLWIAESDGKIVGFLDWFLFPEPSTGKLHGVGQHFYLKPDYRKTDVAGRIYKKATKEMKSNGVQIMELFCFPSELSFWKKKGYEPVRLLVRKEIK